MSVKVTKTVEVEGAFKHTETTEYTGSLSEGDRKVLTVLEVGDAANRQAMADLAVKSLAPKTE